MRKKFIIFGIFCLLAFTLFSWSVKRGAFRTADFAFTVKVQEAIDRSPRLRLSRLVGDVMEGSTFFASPEFSVVAIVVLTIAAFFSLRLIDRSKWGGARACIIPCLFLLLVLAEMYGKTVVHHPAPPFFMIKNPTSIFPKYYINEQFSYPSGHAARAVFISILLLIPAIRHYNNRTMRIKLFFVIGVLGLYVGLVSVSRVYLGHHWLSDIIGGILLGGGFGLLLIGTLELPLYDSRKEPSNFRTSSITGTKRTS